MRIKAKVNRRRNQRLALNMASMIDCTFLLLAYFLLTMVVVQPEDQLSPNLRADRSAASGASSDFQPQIVDVQLLDSGPVYLLGQRSSPQKKIQPWAPLIFASVYLGVGLAARNAVVRYALERVPKALGKTIATLPKIQRLIGEVDVSLMAAKALLLEVADEEQQGSHARLAAAKQYAVEVANEVTDKAIRIAGAAGVSRALPLERYLRDARAGHMHPPNGDAAFETVGQGAIADIEQTE